jgi:hypothetical protein
MSNVQLKLMPLLVGFVLGLAAAARAQEGSVVGVVIDETKALLPGVTVTLVDLATGRQFDAVTNERGEYRVPSVPAGGYRIQAELVGFATVVIARVELLVGQNATVPFTMRVAQVSETLTVTGEAPLVDTRSSQVAGNVDRRQMEELPLQGRNWMELSLLVKGITANDTSNNRPGEATDEHFQLNLDGQQITQRVASSSFGQPKFSREAVAEFQIVTNLFDITQGRSAGIQVQAITRSGTNTLSGSVYGYFRDEKFNAKDHVAGIVLPFQNQQMGGTVGGPLKRDKMLYFAAYEYEREPATFFLQPPQLRGQSFSISSKRIQNSLTARGDYVVNSKNHVSLRASFWNLKSPVELSGSDHPSNGSKRTQESFNALATWSHIIDSNRVQELKIGYNGFNWQNLLAFPQVGGSPQPFGRPADPSARFQADYVFPGLIVGPPRNFPQLFVQHMGSARYDLNWHLNAHDLKIGGEFLGWKDTGEWHLLQRGEFIFNSRPPDLERRFPASGALDPSTWDVAGLDGLVNRFQQNVGDWTINIPRPSWAIWFGDTWRMSDHRLTVNYGVRWDVDWGATAPPDVTTTIPFTPAGGLPPFADVVDIRPGDPLFKSGIRDLKNVAPRAGFTWDVTGNHNLVIRGGSGLFYTVSSSNITFSQQSFNTQRILVNSYPNDGRPGFLQDPTRGVTPADVLAGKVPLPPQSPRVIAHDYRLPHTWQSSLGFQKQLSPGLGVEADLVHWREYNSPRSRELNVFFDPATGYNRDVRFGRPDPKFTSIRWIESKGRHDYMALSSGVTRRFKDNFQAGMTYTLMFFKHDDTNGDWGYFPNNPFNPGADWARSNSFQRNTLRLNGIYRLPWDISIAGAYFYGSGNAFTTTVAGTDPFGKGSSENRLNIRAPIQIPSRALGRFDGPSVIGTGETVPRNALRGKPLHKVDIRVTKDIKLPGTVKMSGIAEVFNLFDHANFGSYNGQVNTATFGDPQQNTANAYVPRSGQFAFRIAF